MQTREMMQRDIITVTSDISLAAARRLMTEKHIRHLPVVSNERLIGIVTDRDIRNASPSPATTLSKGEVNYQLATHSIETCMTKDVITVSPDVDLLQVGQRLSSGQFSCLPVVEAGRLVGIITEIDLLRGFLAAAAPAGELMKVKDYMNKTPYTLGSNDWVITAFQLMHDKHIRHLPVLSSDAKLIGIVTDRDIRQAGASTAAPLAEYELTYLIQKMTIKDIMTRQVYTIRGETDVAEAGQRFLRHNIGCLPVTDNNDGLEGIITVSDLLQAYIKQH